MNARPAASMSIEMRTAVMSAAPRSGARPAPAKFFALWSIDVNPRLRLLNLSGESVLGQLAVTQGDAGGELDGGGRLVAGPAGSPVRGQVNTDGDDDIPGVPFVGDLGDAGRDDAVGGRVVDLVAEVGDREIIDAVSEHGDASAGIHVEALDVAVGVGTDEAVTHVLAGVGDAAA